MRAYIFKSAWTRARHGRTSFKNPRPCIFRRDFQEFTRTTPVRPRRPRASIDLAKPETSLMVGANSMDNTEGLPYNAKQQSDTYPDTKNAKNGRSRSTRGRIWVPVTRRTLTPMTMASGMTWCYNRAFPRAFCLCRFTRHRMDLGYGTLGARAADAMTSMALMSSISPATPSHFPSYTSIYFQYRTHLIFRAVEFFDEHLSKPESEGESPVAMDPRPAPPRRLPPYRRAQSLAPSRP
ncbi:hypothetical protein K438DRAFT_775591 [Mycena galopus ATCC 62051]|nr:hypothetical protein K438DRAFT_775591 [Mycena galopus ATCC 62051]